MSENYSHLMRNTLDGLSETAGRLYLRLLDAFAAHESPRLERKAFLAACRYEERVGATLDYILRANSVLNLSEEVASKLSDFFAARWQHNFLEREA